MSVQKNSMREKAMIRKGNPYLARERSKTREGLSRDGDQGGGPNSLAAGFL